MTFEEPWGHVSVLCGAICRELNDCLDGWIVDGTLGAGGHAAALLAIAPQARLLGIDADPSAIEIAGRRLAPYGDRVVLRQGWFADAGDILREVTGSSTACAHAALLDLGLCSRQLAEPERGFSFQSAGPLDMRMDPQTGRTAREHLLSLDERALADILRRFGEIHRAKSLARAMLQELAAERLESTIDLAQLAERFFGPRYLRRIHPATQVFQALRILTNDELVQLDQFLQTVPTWLAPGAKVAVISFHSLEDRAVKQAFRAWQQGPAEVMTAGRGNPLADAFGSPVLEVLTRKPLYADEQEQSINPRARSARLRIARRTERPDVPPTPWAGLSR